MESIVAFAFAVNIIQVVVWGQQTASFCLRVYRDEEIDPALSETIKNFRTATQSLQNSLSQDRISTEERGLLEIAQKCGHVADKLLKEVGQVNTSHKKRYLFKAYFKSSFKSSSIKKLKEELAVCQAALETQQLLDLRRRHDLTAIKLDGGFGNLGEDIKNLIRGLESGEIRLAEILMTQHEVTRRLEDITLGVTNFQHTWDNRAVLASLFFPELLHRTESIETTHPKTYEWAVKTPEELSGSNHFRTPSWPNLHQWLEGQGGTYWVCGKPGAGKSTFMKYVIEHTSTKRAIASWSGSADSIIASYFFWSQGVALQKSIEGLLRTILFQILETRPALIAFCGLDSAVGIFAWTKDRLLHSLESIISQANVPIALCLFVDGLDESMDDQKDVIKLVRQVSSHPNVKCVVSSRPLRVLRTAFGSCPQIHLQDLTAKDIDEYASSKLKEIDYPVPMTWNQKSELINGITSKADGVFLWVSLATASILAGITNGDSFDELQSRIEELPSELNDLYSKILSSIELRYRIQAMRYFQLLLLESPHSELEPSVLVLSLVDLGMKEPPQESNSEGEGHFEAVMNGCNRTFLHLQQRCGMLLHLEFDRTPFKVKKETGNKLPLKLHSLRECETLRVKFVHRTIYDFFRETPLALEVGPNKVCHPWNPSPARAAGFIRRASIMEPGVIKSTAVADFDANVKHLATAIAAIRDAEISSGIPQHSLLEQLDLVGRQLFLHIRQQCGFETDLHWCVLLSPHFDDNLVGSGTMASLFELCATAGLVHIVKAKIPQLSAEECTRLLNCALNGLLYLRDGIYLKNSWYCYNGSLLDTSTICRGPAQFENFKARVALIIALLETGADPNAETRCIVRLSLNNEHRPGICDIQEQTLLGRTAWNHFLRMLTSHFYYGRWARKGWQNLDTLPLWAEMAARFLGSGANPSEVVQNVCINIGIDVCDWSYVGSDTMSVKLEGVACASTIIKAYFQNHACGRSILEKLGNEEPSEGTKLDKLILDAHGSLRGVFYKLFDLSDPSLLEVGCSWDISSGIIDHLGPMILGLHKPLWIGLNSDADPGQFCPLGENEVKVHSILSDPGENCLPILNTLRIVFSVIEGMEPQTRVNYEVSSGLPKRDPGGSITYCQERVPHGRYSRPYSQIFLQDTENAPNIQLDA